MGSISLKHLSITAGTPLFTDLNLVIGEGEHVGLIAGNGMGKTTLLRAIAGQVEPSAGDITLSRGLAIGFVEQDVPAALKALTLREAVAEALSPERRDTESWRVDVALDEFETPDALRDRLVAALSGGWQRLMLIARIWVTEPDALLLDEPTNHLDLEKLFWLERWVKRATKRLPMLIASHDRDFLDAVTNRTLFLRPTGSQLFAVPYSAARQALDGRDAAAEVQLDNEMKTVKQLRKQAAKLTNVGINSGSDLLVVKAKQLKDRASKIEDAARPVHRERSGDIRLVNSGTHAKVLAALEDVTVTTPAGDLLFRIAKLHLFQGDRIVLLGRNGTGKSQLIKLIRRAVNGESIEGIRIAGSVVTGYMDQELSQLPPTETPSGFIARRFDLQDQRTRSLLAGAGFVVERQEKPIGSFSFGQRSRLGLLALRLTEPNFYLLDEPTNHIDIAGCEALESEILAHGATAVIVSHDRSFVRTVGTRFWKVEGRRLQEVDSPEPFFAEMAG
ncbi:MAG: family ATP-binding cassette protein [Devosia sp.]|nr:family ATP-binding cassette protein [Devosia sp.]